MNNFFISESEKKRILNMHQNYLFEQTQSPSRFDKRYFEAKKIGTITFDSNLAVQNVDGIQITDAQKQFWPFMELGDNVKGMSGELGYEYKFGPTMRSMGDDESYLELKSGANTGTLYINR